MKVFDKFYHEIFLKRLFARFFSLFSSRPFVVFACRRLCGFLDGVAPDPLLGFPSGFVVKVSIQVPFVLLASHFVLSGSS